MPFEVSCRWADHEFGGAIADEHRRYLYLHTADIVFMPLLQCMDSALQVVPGDLGDGHRLAGMRIE
jgi:hypothetical protein